MRYFEADASVFLDDDYLIKGVAGAVLWKLLRDHAREGRTEFSNRELRLSPEIRLPDVSDNLEARLVLLARRLVEREACVRIEKTGRGRFRLCVAARCVRCRLGRQALRPADRDARAREPAWRSRGRQRAARDVEHADEGLGRHAGLHAAQHRRALGRVQRRQEPVQRLTIACGGIDATSSRSMASSSASL